MKISLTFNNPELKEIFERHINSYLVRASVIITKIDPLQEQSANEDGSTSYATAMTVTADLVDAAQTVTADMPTTKL